VQSFEKAKLAYERGVEEHGGKGRMGAEGRKEKGRRQQREWKKENMGKREILYFSVNGKLITTSKNAEISIVTEHWLN